MASVLLPLATVVTPNIPEAEVLAGMEIKTECRHRKSGETYIALGAKAVVVKGGHRKEAPYAEDLFMRGGWGTFLGPCAVDGYERYAWNRVHVFGSTNSVFGKWGNIGEAVVSAKCFIHAAIENGLEHWWRPWSDESLGV